MTTMTMLPLWLCDTSFTSRFVVLPFSLHSILYVLISYPCKQFLDTELDVVPVHVFVFNRHPLLSYLAEFAQVLLYSICTLCL